MFGDLKLLWDLWGYWGAIKEGAMDEAKWLQLATLLIPFIAPLITAGLKKILPKLPKLLIVILQPILGAILGAITGEPAAGAALGAGGLYVREFIDQGGKALGLIPPKTTGVT